MTHSVRRRNPRLSAPLRGSLRAFVKFHTREPHKYSNFKKLFEGLIPSHSPATVNVALGYLKGSKRMGTVRDEYARFVATIAGAPLAVRKVAEVVERNLDAIGGTVRNRGQRGAMLTPLLLSELAQESQSDRVEPQAEGSTHQPAWTRIQSVQLGPFRGFRRSETFTFEKRLVLIYGPNGSGKSSLCEAIEFGLLGTLAESRASRQDSTEDYLRNAHAGAFAIPVLTSDAGAIAPDESRFRFCVIEKNRIDAFARIAAHSPAAAEELIATLFGLDKFAAFVRNFSSLDGPLNISTPLGDQLALLRAELSDATAFVAAVAMRSRAFDDEASNIAAEHDVDLPLPDLLGQLGLAGAPGRLQELQELTDKTPPLIVNVDSTRLTAARMGVRTFRRKLKDLEARLAERALQLPFDQLFSAVTALREHSPDNCPACLTPLSATSSDPFQRAQAGAKDLSEVRALRDERDTARLDLAEARRILQQHFLSARELIQPGQSADITQTTSSDWRSLRLAVEAVEKENILIGEELAQRAEWVESKRRLEDVKALLADVSARRIGDKERLDESQQKIAAFDEANATLIAGAEAEALSNRHKQSVKDAYDEFTTRLNTYLQGLPTTLLADLNEATRDLYNSFNTEDDGGNQLLSVSLPLQANDRLTIELAGAPGSHHDALRLLSEGHIRCLGLAILLAKATSLELPVIIFDDVVNAIDDAHRESIRETLLDREEFANVQLILSCHSNEFIREFQHKAGQGETTLYVIAPHSGDFHPGVSGGDPRHLVEVANRAYAQLNYGACLASCRQAFDSLTMQCWKQLGVGGKLTLKLTAPGAPPELRELTDQLRARISEGRRAGTLTGDRWRVREEAMQSLTDHAADDRLWFYLNRGTHINEIPREDFERGKVQRILLATEAIDNTFVRQQAGRR